MATDASIWFDASFGNVDLLVLDIDTEAGRDIAVKSPSRGDKHALQDRGAKLLATNATVLFCIQPGKDSYLDRFDAFRAAAAAGPDIFVHPLLDAYRARIEGFTFSASAEERSVTVKCRILAEDEPQQVFTPGAGVSSDAGLDSVTVASSLADTAIATAGLTLPTPVTANALAAVTSWSATDLDDLDTNAVTSATATITGQIATAISALNLEQDLVHWPVYQALINLSYQLSRAATSFASQATNVFDLTITVPQALRAICARVYGPALAEDRQRQVTKMNRIRTPGRVPAGTYKFPSDGAQP